MLARLDLKLSCAERLSYQMSSLFHGALMELLPKEYAAYLHQSRLHPYTQHLEVRDCEWRWVICCMDEASVQQIIREALLSLTSIEIRKRQLRVDIMGKDYRELPHKELTDMFYEAQGSRYINLHFLTPTAFKQNGAYLFFPDIRCLYQSLMNKYDAVLKEESMLDEDTLAQLCERTQLIRYDLKSAYFYLEQTRIPSYIGKITLKLTGSQTMANFANLLFTFGQYSGVGIKTALGMGAYRIIRDEVMGH